LFTRYYWKIKAYVIINDQFRLTQQIIQAYHKATTIYLEEWTHYWQRLKIDLMVCTAWIADQARTLIQLTFITARRVHSYLQVVAILLTQAIEKDV
jgi:hypothetical protein